MLPNTGNIIDLISDDNPVEQTQTFALNLSNNTIGGKIDGLDALKQSIYLALSIEADQYIIYSYTYGLNTLDLIGKPVYYVAAVLPGRIKETLLSDSRILDVSDFKFNANRNKLYCEFIVHSIYGDFKEETEVAY